MRRAWRGEDSASSRVMWALGTAGGTTRAMSRAAQWHMSLMAVTFASPWDVVVLPRQGAALVPEGGPLVVTYALDHSWANAAVAAAATLGQSNDIDVVVTPSRRCSAHLERMREGWGARIVPHASDVGWEHKPTMHRLLAAGCVPRPRTWSCGIEGQAAMTGPLVLKGDGGTYVARELPGFHAGQIVEEYLEDVGACNCQYLVDGRGGYELLLGTVQITSRSSDGALGHAGNLRPTRRRSAPGLGAHEGVARRAAELVSHSGFTGLVGVDTIGRAGEVPLVVDINPRINASTFMVPRGEVDALLFMFGRRSRTFRTGPSLPPKSVAEWNVSPPISVGSEVAVNLGLTARCWRDAVASLYQLEASFVGVVAAAEVDTQVCRVLTT